MPWQGLNLERAIEECLNETPIIEEADAEYYDEWEYTQRTLLKDVESYFNKLAVILGAMFLGARVLPIGLRVWKGRWKNGLNR